MTENELNEIIDLFPCRSRKVLSNSSMRKAFLDVASIKYNDLRVYRAVRGTKIIEDDFKMNLDKQNISLKTLEAKMESGSIRIGNIGVSVFQDRNELETIMKFPSERYKSIAIGTMRSKYGPADISFKNRNNTHYNWFIYVDSICEVIKEFEIII